MIAGQAMPARQSQRTLDDATQRLFNPNIVAELFWVHGTLLPWKGQHGQTRGEMGWHIGLMNRNIDEGTLFGCVIEHITRGQWAAARDEGIRVCDERTHQFSTRSKWRAES